MRPRRRADAAVVEHHLPRRCLLRLTQAAIQLKDVGDVLADLVASAVAADDGFLLCGVGECAVQSSRDAPPGSANQASL